MSRLIDADELVKRARPIENFPNGTMVVVLGVVKSLPTVDAEPVKRGFWIEHEYAEEVDGRLIPNYECSACGRWSRRNTHFCPECGSRNSATDKDEVMK